MNDTNEELRDSMDLGEAAELLEGARIDAAQAWLVREGGACPEEVEDLEPEKYDEAAFKNGSMRILVLTDEEACYRAGEEIAGSLWAFEPWFLARYVLDGIGEDEIRAIVGDRCDDANSAVLALVDAGKGLVPMIEGAIGEIGRGHFLAVYDGQEREFDHGVRTWYVYRV